MVAIQWNENGTIRIGRIIDHNGSVGMVWLGANRFRLCFGATLIVRVHLPSNGRLDIVTTGLILNDDEYWRHTTWQSRHTTRTATIKPKAVEACCIGAIYNQTEWEYVCVCEREKEGENMSLPLLTAPSWQSNSYRCLSFGISCKPLRLANFPSHIPLCVVG